MNIDKEKRKKELLQLLQEVDQPQQHRVAETREKQPKNSSGARSDSESEKHLITRCKSGDRAAFDQVIQRYQDHVYTYIHHVLQDDEKALHVTRDVFVEAYKTISRFQEEGALRVWLLKVAEKRVRTVFTKPDALPDVPLKSEATECDTIGALLSGYIDDALSESEIHRVEDHLAACAQCYLEYEKLQEAVDLVHTFGSMQAPASLRREINAALETQPFWRPYLNYLKPLKKMFSYPVPQIATAAATIALIVLVTLSSSQREQIRQLETQLRAVRTAIVSPTEEITPTTFVIFTGKIVSEEMPLEAGEYTSSIISEPEKAKQWFIPGNITDTGDKIAEYIRSIQGKITADQPISHNVLTIRKITAELPEHSNSMVSLFLQQLEEKPTEPDETPDLTTIPIEIAIIDKQ